MMEIFILIFVLDVYIVNSFILYALTNQSPSADSNIFVEKNIRPCKSVCYVYRKKIKAS